MTHLQAIRASVDALIALEEADFVQAQQEQGCPHPEQHRRNATTFGTEPRFKCMACGEIVKGVA